MAAKRKAISRASSSRIKTSGKKMSQSKRLKRFEEKLQRSEERYHTLFDLVPVAVYTCDANGIIQEYNRRPLNCGDASPPNGEKPRFCGSYKIYYPDGRYMPHKECPMARAVTRRKTESRKIWKSSSNVRMAKRRHVHSGSANSYKHSRQNHRRESIPFLTSPSASAQRRQPCAWPR